MKSSGVNAGAPRCVGAGVLGGCVAADGVAPHLALMPSKWQEKWWEHSKTHHGSVYWSTCAACSMHYHNVRRRRGRGMPSLVQTAAGSIYHLTSTPPELEPTSPATFSPTTTAPTTKKRRNDEVTTLESAPSQGETSHGSDSPSELQIIQVVMDNDWVSDAYYRYVDSIPNDGIKKTFEEFVGGVMRGVWS